MPSAADIVHEILVGIYSLRERGQVSSVQARALKVFLIRFCAEAVADLEKSSRTARQVAQSWLWTHVRALTSAGGDDGLLAIAPHPRSIEREKQRHLQVFHSAFHRILTASLYPGDTTSGNSEPLHERVTRLQNVSWRHILAVKRRDLVLLHDGEPCTARVTEDGELLEWTPLEEGASVRCIHLDAVDGVRVRSGAGNAFELMFAGDVLDRFEAPSEEDLFTWLVALGSILSSRRHGEVASARESQSTNDLLWQAARVRLSECDPGMRVVETLAGIEGVLRDVEAQTGRVKRFVEVAEVAED